MGLLQTLYINKDEVTFTCQGKVVRSQYKLFMMQWYLTCGSSETVGWTQGENGGDEEDCKEFRGRVDFKRVSVSMTQEQELMCRWLANGSVYFLYILVGYQMNILLLQRSNLGT
jgi:hypothetical protein